MKTLGYALVALAWGVLRLAVRLLSALGRRARLLLVPVLAWYLHRRALRARRVAQPALPVFAQAPVAVPLPVAVSQDAVPGANTCSPPVADRIVALPLEPPVGVIHLRLYLARRTIQRELLLTEPALRARMRGRRHVLPDVAFDPMGGLEAIKDQAVQAAEDLINQRAAASRAAPRQPQRQHGRATPAVAAPSAAALPAPVAMLLPAPVQRPEPQDRRDASAAASTGAGATYVGELLSAGFQSVAPTGRAPYEIFEATLRLDTGDELALRGAELQRELQASGCTVGERLAITALGKLPLTLADGRAGHKNLYRVRRAAPATDIRAA